MHKDEFLLTKLLDETHRAITPLNALPNFANFLSFPIILFLGRDESFYSTDCAAKLFMNASARVGV